MGQEDNLSQYDVAPLRGYDAPANDAPARWDDTRDDIEVRDTWGQVIWVGPRYLRCLHHECHLLVTPGMVSQGGCWCGNRRLGAALRLTSDERGRLQRGYYPLAGWEQEQIPMLALPEGKTLGWGRQEWEEAHG